MSECVEDEGSDYENENSETDWLRQTEFNMFVY